MNPLSQQSELENLLQAFYLPSFTKNYQWFARQVEEERVDHVAALAKAGYWL